jgi:hypothetical protein
MPDNDSTPRQAQARIFPRGPRPIVWNYRQTQTGIGLIRRPAGVAQHFHPPPPCHNAIGVVSISDPEPKVGALRQPWAEGHNPFGIGSAGHPRIPTGFRLKAQGCEARAALGHRPQIISNRNAVVAIPFRLPRAVLHNRVAVDDWFDRRPKAGAGAPTLGWRPQSLWDCQKAANSALTRRRSCRAKVSSTPAVTHQDVGVGKREGEGGKGFQPVACNKKKTACVFTDGHALRPGIGQLDLMHLANQRNLELGVSRSPDRNAHRCLSNQKNHALESRQTLDQLWCPCRGGRGIRVPGQRQTPARSLYPSLSTQRILFPEYRQIQAQPGSRCQSIRRIPAFGRRRCRGRCDRWHHHHCPVCFSVRLSSLCSFGFVVEVQCPDASASESDTERIRRQ